MKKLAEVGGGVEFVGLFFHVFNLVGGLHYSCLRRL